MRARAGILNAANALLGSRRLSRGSYRSPGAVRCSRFLGLWSDNRALGEGDGEFVFEVGERKGNGSTHTSPSVGSPIALFLVPAAAVDLVWRAELRVERVNVVTGSVSSPSPRFLLDDVQRRGHTTGRAYLGHHAYGRRRWTSEGQWLMGNGCERDVCCEMNCAREPLSIGETLIFEYLNID